MSPTIRLPSPSSDYPLKHIKTGVSHLKKWQLTPVSMCFIIVLLHFIHFLYTYVAILTDIIGYQCVLFVCGLKITAYRQKNI